MSEQQCDFFATRMEVEDMRNGCARIWFFSDRSPPFGGTEKMLLTIVVPNVALKRYVGLAADVIAEKGPAVFDTLNRDVMQ